MIRIRAGIFLLFCLLSSFAFAKDIVMIGDSLSCGPFGKNLVKNLSSQGNSVTLLCAISSTPSNWLQGKNPKGQICQTMTSVSMKLVPCGGTGAMPNLQAVMAAHKGAQFILALGTNSLGAPRVDSSYKRLAKMAGTSGSCKWIGPPHMNPPQAKGFSVARLQGLEKNLNSFYDSLSGAVDAHCDLIDSRDATAAGTGGAGTVDGVHRNEKAGRYWAQQIRGYFLKQPAASASRLQSNR